MAAKRPGLSSHYADGRMLVRMDGFRKVPSWLKSCVSKTFLNSFVVCSSLGFLKFDGRFL